jgi:hypothetical protein
VDAVNEVARRAISFEQGCHVDDPTESMLSTCSTRTLVDEDVVRDGRVPPPAAPRLDHDTDQSIVVVTMKDPSFGLPSVDGWSIEVILYVCRHAVDGTGEVDRYGTPGPAQVVAKPSPVDQTTTVGMATAVALTPPTVAVTL